MTDDKELKQEKTENLDEIPKPTMQDNDDKWVKEMQENDYFEQILFDENDEATIEW